MGKSMCEKIFLCDEIADIIIKKADLNWGCNEDAQVAYLQTENGNPLSDEMEVIVELPETEIETINKGQVKCGFLRMNWEGCISFCSTKGENFYYYDIMTASLEKVLKLLRQIDFGPKLAELK